MGPCILFFLSNSKRKMRAAAGLYAGGGNPRHSRFRTRVSRCETPAHQAGAMAGLCDPGIALLRRPAAPKQNLPLICLAPKFPQDCQEPRAEAHGVWFLSTRKSVFLLAGSSQEIANTGFPLFQQ